MFVLIYFFINKYVFCLYNMPDKRRLVTYNIYFGSEKAGLLENSYHKCALADVNSEEFTRNIYDNMKRVENALVLL